MDRSVVFTPREPVLPGGLFLNCLCLLAISGCLGLLLYLQVVLPLPPNPLRQLQCTGVILTGIGFMRNLRFGIKSAHYGVALVGALLTVALLGRDAYYVAAGRRLALTDPADDGEADGSGPSLTVHADA